MRKFFGRTYLYPTPSDGTVQIGVCRGLGDSWIVGYERPGSSSTKRIKTSHLPVMSDPTQLQDNLDTWAGKRNLVEFEEVPDVPPAA